MLSSFQRRGKTCFWRADIFRFLVSNYQATKGDINKNPIKAGVRFNFFLRISCLVEFVQVHSFANFLFFCKKNSFSNNKLNILNKLLTQQSVIYTVKAMELICYRENDYWFVSLQDCTVSGFHSVS